MTLTRRSQTRGGFIVHRVTTADKRAMWKRRAEPVHFRICRIGLNLPLADSKNHRCSCVKSSYIPCKPPAVVMQHTCQNQHVQQHPSITALNITPHRSTNSSLQTRQLSLSRLHLQRYPATARHTWTSIFPCGATDVCSRGGNLTPPSHLWRASCLLCTALW